MRTLTPETTAAALWRPSVRAFARRCAARVLLRVTLAELVDAAAGIHDLVLARVERVRGRRHVDLDQRVLVAVFPLDRLLAAKGRAGQELEIGSHVLERSEEHTSELPSLMRSSYAVFCFKIKKNTLQKQQLSNYS